MGLDKKNIAKNISAKITISQLESLLLLNTFIELIKNNTKNSTLKIASFGTFITKKTPKRIGRNPKTKQEFQISESSKLKFFASNKLKKFIN